MAGIVRRYLEGYLREGLRFFCLERWQSLHENYARILLSDSGVEPLSLGELRGLGVDLSGMEELDLGYGWTRGTPELREAISGLYGGAVGPEGVLVTNGSAEANLVTALALIRRGDTVLVDMPNYLQLRGLLEWLGSRVVEVHREPPDWGFPVGRTVELFGSLRPKALFITEPNNPTGAYLSRGEAEELVEEAQRRGVLIVADEVYHGSERGEQRPSLLEIGGPGAVVSVSGLSKVYGLPGLRIGWLAGPRELVERAWAAKDYTSIAPSRLSDFIASRILGNPRVVEELRERARRIVAENSRILGEAIEEAGLAETIDYRPPPAGAYTYLGLPVKDTAQATELLYERYGILVNPGECFGRPGYIRVGLGSRPERFQVEAQELARALSGILAETR